MDYKLKKYMTNDWWNVVDSKAIKDFITQTFLLECPIYLRNAHCGIRFNFDDLSAKQTAQVAGDITAKIFSDKEFYLLYYFSIGIPPKLLKRYIKGNPNKETCIEYETLHNADDFVPNYNNVSFVKVDGQTFNINKYVKDIAYGHGSESDIYLVNMNESCALHFYDCRGMDIVSLDKKVLIDLYNSFEEYISPYNKEEIRNNLFDNV